MVPSNQTNNDPPPKKIGWTSLGVPATPPLHATPDRWWRYAEAVTHRLRELELDPSELDAPAESLEMLRREAHLAWRRVAESAEITAGAVLVPEGMAAKEGL